VGQSLGTAASDGVYCISRGCEMSVLLIGMGRIEDGEGEACHSATILVINLTWTSLGSNPELQSEIPLTNHILCYTSCLMAFSEFDNNLKIILLSLSN
jgi:hypothetical protein